MAHKNYPLPKQKHFPQIDSEGYYNGLAVADASPLEPGKYLIPAGALDVDRPPREANTHEAIRWTGEVWVYEPDFRGAMLYSTQAPDMGQRINPQDIKRGDTLDSLHATFKKPQSAQVWDSVKNDWVYTLPTAREIKLTALAELRWAVQCAGVHVGAVAFDSSPEAAARLKCTIDDTQLIGEDRVMFKTKSGFVDMGVDELQNVYVNIVRHTQACYKNEAAHVAQINTIEDVDMVLTHNIASGWPD